MIRETAYLRDNPQARAEDIMWAFENKDIRGIIANIECEVSKNEIGF